MIVDNGKYFLYRHIRHDKNEPFYIGVGSVKNGCRNYSIYKRAYITTGKNIIWQKITAKTSYSVDILFESETRLFIHQKETEFIKLYGRIDLSTGSLSNLTDGGDGGVNMSKNSILKQIESKKKSGSFYKNKEHLKKYRLPKGGNADWCERECFIYCAKSGEFINSFKSAVSCSKFVGFVDSRVSYMCRKEYKYRKWVFTYRNYGAKVFVSDFQIKGHFDKKVVQYDKDGVNKIKIWDSAKKASLFYGLTRTAVANSILRGVCARGYKWGWYDVLEEKEYTPSAHHWASWRPICKVDIVSRAVAATYKSITDAAKEHNVSTAAIGNVLRKKSKQSCGFHWEYLNT